MNCPNCGTWIDSPGKFCAECGARLPSGPGETATAGTAETLPSPGPVPPSLESAAPSPPELGKTPPPPPLGIERPRKITNSNPASRRPPGPSPAGGGFGGLVALAGAGLAIASAWLPWWMAQSEPFDATAWGRPVEVAEGLANGRYLIAAAAVAAACGLMLAVRLGRNGATRTFLALLVLAGAAGIGIVEYSAYRELQDMAGTGQTTGWGLYAGIAGAVVAAMGGLLALVSRPGRAGATVGSRVLIGLTGLAGAALLVAAAILALPRLTGAEQPGVAAASAPPQGSPGPASTATSTISPGTPSPVAPVDPSTSPGPSARPSGTFLTSGYASPEQAIGQFVGDQGYTYAGSCGAAIASSDYCSQFIANASGGRVYAVGGTSSEAEAWLLLRQVGSQWFVAEAATASGGNPPPWH